MADHTINGWPLLQPDSDRLKSKAVPGVKNRKLQMEADVLPLFLNFARWYDKRIYRLNKPGDTFDEWSYSAPRKGNAAPTSWSDHSSGTAVDLNATTVGAQGPRERSYWEGRSKRLRTLGQKRYKIVEKGLRKYGVLMWGGASDLGGDYTQPKNWDWMHFAIKPGVSRADVKAQIAKMKIGPDGRRAR